MSSGSGGDGDLADLAEPVRERFLDRHQAREVAYSSSRDATRAAANAIRAIHRGDTRKAHDLLTASGNAYRTAVDAAEEHPDVLFGGFVQDAAKEYAEATITVAVLSGEPWPTVEDVGVDDGSWLHGLAETVGELRRRSLDLIRAEDLAGAENLLERMDDVLAVLATIDVPDALTRGLRRATDVARSITERTRGDLTNALGQRRLREALDRHREVLERTVPDA